MSISNEEEEEYVDNIIPLFSTNILSQGKFTLPSGVELLCFTRANTHISSSFQDCLFVDDVWPGSRVLADFLVTKHDYLNGKVCLELGAGGALPSLVAASLGAKKVVITDYPAPGVIENICSVIVANSLSNAIAVGHIWGKDNTKMLVELGEISCSGEQQGFDVILLAELLWKDTYNCHRKLLESLSTCLNRKTGIAYMTVSHRPTSDLLGHTAEKDLEFFTLAATDYGLQSTLLRTCSKYCDVGETVPIDVHLFSLQYPSVPRST